MKMFDEQRAALEAVTLAALLTEEVRAKEAPATLQKGDRSPVTVADFGSQALVCRALKQHFPDDEVIAEERADALRQPSNKALLDRVVQFVNAQVPGAGAGQILDWIDRGSQVKYTDRFWTLDPIDGTKGFLRGDQYAIALALVVEGKPVVAALACPALVARETGLPGTVMVAVRGEGVREYPLSNIQGPGLPVRVSGQTDPVLARFCESFESGHSSHGDAARVATELGISLSPLRMDSQAKYAVVARGDADIYMRLPRTESYLEKIWDHAAGILVVEEAGGTTSDVLGVPLDFGLGHTLKNNTGVAVTNGALHADLLGALNHLSIGV